MARARRELAQSMKLVDLVIETLDEKKKKSSQNPDIARILAGKQKVVALNKADLADPRANDSWRQRYSSGGAVCALVNARTSKGVAPLREQIAIVGAAKAEKLSNRGVVARPVRVMVVGIPNSGKSTIINSLAKRASAMTGDKPGVTRSRQWIKLGGGVELLDTPGVLWPRFDDEAVGFRLAATGAIKDEIIDTQTVAERLLRTLMRDYPKLLEDRYGISRHAAADGYGYNEGDGVAGREGDGDGDSYVNGDNDGYGDGDVDGDNGREADGRDNAGFEALSMLRAVCAARGFLARGGAPDVARAASTGLDEFRAGRIGRITLEWPKAAK
jgi:ribosome biogenesis GTPase A